MSKKIKNLSNKEEWIFLDLKNIQHPVNLFLKVIDKKENESHKDGSQLTWYKDVFIYYKNQLLPALQESTEMEERHLAIFENNQDTGFSIITKEVEYHQALYIEFSNRFETIYKEFMIFCLGYNKTKLFPYKSIR